MIEDSSKLDLDSLSIQSSTMISDEIGVVEDISESLKVDSPVDIIGNEDLEEHNEKFKIMKEENVVSTDDKFRNCVYYKGMDVEEYLRSNPDYRDAEYVEHFYSKEVLDKMLISGLILIRKGKYRL